MAPNRQAIIWSNDGLVYYKSICVIRPQWVNTLRPGQNGHQATYFNTFPWFCFVLNRISVKFVTESPIDPSHKSQNASVPYPTMQHFVTEMCTCVHISVTKWCIVGYLSDALWDLWDGSIDTKFGLAVRKISSEWLPWSPLGTLKLAFNVSSDDQGIHPDDLCVSVVEVFVQAQKVFSYTCTTASPPM